MVYGFGLDMFPTIITAIHTSEFGSAEAHNDVVKFFVEGGIIGLSIYVLWMVWYIVCLYRLSRDQSRDDKERELLLFASILLLSVLIASLSDAVFKSTPIQWIVWIVVFSILGVTKRQQVIDTNKS